MGESDAEVTGDIGGGDDVAASVAEGRQIVDVFEASGHAIDDNPPKEVEENDSILARTGWIDTSFVGKVNRNNRYYPDEVWESTINSEYVQSLVSERGMFGNLDHPDDPKMEASNTAHIVSGIRKRGDVIQSRYDILNYGDGIQEYVIIDAGGSLAVSTRGTGSLKKRDDGVKVVQENYRLHTIDWVADGGFADTRFDAQDVEGMAERVESIAESAGRDPEQEKTKLKKICDGMNEDGYCYHPELEGDGGDDTTQVRGAGIDEDDRDDQNEPNREETTMGENNGEGVNEGGDRADLETLEGYAELVTDLKEDIEQRDERIEEMEQEIAALKGDNAEEQLDEVRQERDELEAKFEKVSEAADELGEKLREKEDDLEEARERNEELRSTISEMQEVIDDQKEFIEFQFETMDSMDERYNALYSILEDVKGEVTEEEFQNHVSERCDQLGVDEEDFQNLVEAAGCDKRKFDRLLAEATGTDIEYLDEGAGGDDGSGSHDNLPDEDRIEEAIYEEEENGGDDDLDFGDDEDMEQLRERVGSI